MMIYVQTAILGPLQKVISHKYINDVISCMMIYVQTAILGLLQKVISHKYANGVISCTMIYVQAAILGPLQKKKEEEEKVDVPFKSPRGAPFPSSFVTSLRCTLAAASSEDDETGRHLRLVKHFGERKFGESGIQSRAPS